MDCALSVAFSPTVSQSGTVNGQVVLTDNSYNTAGVSPATQTIALTGKATGTPAASVFSAANSTLVAAQNPALIGPINSSAGTLLTATVKDQYGNPVSGVTVNFNPMGNGNLAFTNSGGGITNANGQASVTMYDTVVETATVSAAVSGSVSGTISSIQVQFMAPAYVVAVVTDPATGNGTAGHCVPSGQTGDNSQCSLRDAVAAADALLSTTVPVDIGFAPALTANATASNPVTISMAQSNAISMTDSINLHGPGAALLMVSGGTTPLSSSNQPIFSLTAGTSTLSGLSFLNAYGSLGSAISDMGATLTVNSCVFAGSLSSSNGGAVFAGTGSPVTITGSTFNNNQSGSGTTGNGGAVSAYTSLTVSDSTFVGNTSGTGGAVFANAALVLVNNTFSGNHANVTAGAVAAMSSMTANGNIFASDTNAALQGNFPGIESGSSGNADHNVFFGGDTCGLCHASTNPITGDPRLATLGNYGGPTPTMLPLPGSSAICGNVQQTVNSVVVTTDERGVTVPGYGGSCYDIGAVQTAYALAFTTSPGNTAVNQSVSPTPVVTLQENGTALTAAAVGISVSGAHQNATGTATQNTSTAQATAGQASFPGLSFATPETGEQLVANLTLTSSAGLRLSVASASFNITAASTGTSTGNSTVAALPSPAVAGTAVQVTVTIKDSNGNAINGATAGFTSTSPTVSFGTPSVSGNVITVTMTDTAAETASISVTLGGAASGTLSGSEQFVAPAYTVTVVSDPVAANESAAHCVANGLTGSNANCSLREAVDAANALTGVTANIGFAGAAVGTATNPAIILIAQTRPMTISANMNINGPGANLLTIEGGATPFSTSNKQVFRQTGGASAIFGMTVANGYSGTLGGGLYQSGGSLSIAQCAFSGNEARNGGAVEYAGTLSVKNSTFNGNQATSFGGALYGESGATANFAENTFTANQAGNEGGAVLFEAANATLVNNTFSANQAGAGSAIYSEDYNATLNTRGNIFSSNPASAGSSGIFADNNGGSGATVKSDHDLYSGGDGCVGCATVTNKIAADPKLSALGYYGGPTQTLLPLPGSAAICAGVQESVSADQRGSDIPTTYSGRTCYDIGSVQTAYAFGFTTQPPPTPIPPATAMSPAPIITITESGMALTGGAATVNVTDAASDLSAASTKSATSSAAIATAGQATFTNLLFTGPATGDTLTATLVLDASLATPLSLTTTSNAFTVGLIVNTITFPTLSNTAFTSTAPMPAATASSGVTVSYATTSAACSVTTAGVITFNSTGSCAITASQGATGNYAAAAPVTQSFSITPGVNTITFPALSNTALTSTPPTPTATASSGVAVSYATTSAACSVTTAGVITFNSTGSCAITASQGATGNYGAAAPVTQSFSITPGVNTITFTQPASPVMYGSGPIVLSASASSNLPVAFSVLPGNTATYQLTGNTLTLTSAGSLSVAADQSGNTNYVKATQVVYIVVVSRQSTTTTLLLNTNAITPIQTINLTAQVAPVVPGSVTPTGSVVFYDGSTAPATSLSGAVTLVNGQAKLNGLVLQSGPHALYVVYSSDTNYLASTSPISTATTVTVAAEDFVFTAAGSTYQSVIPGSTGVFTFQVTPLYEKYPTPVTFTVTGLPAGATYTVSPAVIGTNAGPQTVTVTIQTPPAVATQASHPSILWAVALLVPLALKRRLRKQLPKIVMLLLLLFAGGWGLSGCGSGSSVNGYFGQQAKSYSITITGTSGTVTHSSTVTLQVQ